MGQDNRLTLLQLESLDRMDRDNYVPRAGRTLDVLRAGGFVDELRVTDAGKARVAAFRKRPICVCCQRRILQMRCVASQLGGNEHLRCSRGGKL